MLALVVALLYFCCFAAMGALVFLITFRGRSQSRQRPRSRRLRRIFFLLTLCLLLWQLTLFLEARTTLPVLQLYLGRANFTAIVFASYLALTFVRQVAKNKPISRAGTWVNRVLLMETVALAAVTLLTPLVAAEEWVVASASGIGHPSTRFGPLLPLYLLHVIGCWLAAITWAFGGAFQKGIAPARKKQLILIGSGIVATGTISVITNALLPAVYDEFRFCDVGTLSTLCFLVAVAYAVFVHNLFDVRVVVRETLVFGILLAFVLGAYSSSAFLLVQYLTESGGKLTQFVVLFLAFSFDPLRRFLEDKVDRLLFGRESRRTRSRDGREN